MIRLILWNWLKALLEPRIHGQPVSVHVYDACPVCAEHKRAWYTIVEDGPNTESGKFV